MLTKWMNQGHFPVIDKVSEAEVVAYTHFRGLHEVARHVWMLRDWIHANDLHIAGMASCTMHVDGIPGVYLNGNTPCEVQWRVAGCPRPEVERMGVKLLEPQRILSTFHLGDTQTIPQTFAFLREVIEAEGYRANGHPREVYFFEVSDPKSRWITECQIPVEKILYPQK